jgi:tripeptidyl-peptidase I
MLVRHLVAVLGAGLALGAVASPLAPHAHLNKKRELPASYKLHERHMSHVPRYWAKRSKVPDTALLPMRIGLKQRNLDMGHATLMEMYVSVNPCLA